MLNWGTRKWKLEGPKLESRKSKLENRTPHPVRVAPKGALTEFRVSSFEFRETKPNEANGLNAIIVN